MSDRYVVAGNPVAHSMSPWIHVRFARQTEQDMDYTTLLIEPGHFAEAAAQFLAGGGKGMNITLPFKLDACAFAHALTDRARQAGAVNTLALRPDGGVLGDNTDGAGLMRDLEQNLGWSVAGKRILLLGAGGAARGVLGSLLAGQPAAVVIANRTVATALQLATLFAGQGELSGCGFDGLDGCFDLIINASSASLGNQVPPLSATSFHAHTRCYDMAYSRGPTVFLRWARINGAAAVADGLGMLVEQAADSFLIWRGLRPETAKVLAELRALMSAGQ